MNWLKLKADGVDRVFFSIVLAGLFFLGKASETPGLESSNGYESAGGNVFSLIWWAFIVWLFISGVGKYRSGK